MSSVLEEGYQCLIEFTSRPTVKFYEIEVTPSSIGSGALIDVTTQRNTTWKTSASRKLKETGEMQVLCAYDPAVHADILALVGVEDSITTTYPDGDTVVQNGVLTDAKFGALKIGERPTVTLTIGGTNRDPSTGAEEGPVHAA